MKEYKIRRFNFTTCVEEPLLGIKSINGQITYPPHPSAASPLPLASNE
jgi:hypothetical protein